MFSPDLETTKFGNYYQINKNSFKKEKKKSILLWAQLLCFGFVEQICIDLNESTKKFRRFSFSFVLDCTFPLIIGPYSRFSRDVTHS